MVVTSKLAVLPSPDCPRSGAISAPATSRGCNCTGPVATANTSVTPRTPSMRIGRVAERTRKDAIGGGVSGDLASKGLLHMILIIHKSCLCSCFRGACRQVDRLPWSAGAF